MQETLQGTSPTPPKSTFVAARTGAPKIESVPPGGQRPKVSVVTASFNAGAALEATIETVAAQSFYDVEHVVVDGGSTDGTVTSLEARGESLRWVSEPDQGIADAMNKAVAMARGEWIVVLQAGDTFAAASSLAEAVRHLSEDRDVLCCGIKFGADDAPILQHNPARRLYFKPIAHQGVLCRRAVFERVGGFDKSYHVTMDYEFFLRARNDGARFAAAPLVLARMDDGGISSQRNWTALARRFTEERRAQTAHCPTPWMRIVYALYWPPYLAYRRLRAAFGVA